MTTTTRRGRHRVDLTQRKSCAVCGTEFAPIAGRSHQQWAQARYCSRRCANTAKARRQRPGLAAQRGWATAWESHRRADDLRDIRQWRARQARRQRRIARATRPLAPPRRFVGSTCEACGETWVQYANRVDSRLCSTCTKRKWQGDHRQRARRYGATYQHVARHAIFAADGHRCQICGSKTSGVWPAPTSATIDHIVPLARGGHHVPENLQTACLSCNVRKGAGTANDQLRLATA